MRKIRCWDHLLISVLTTYPRRRKEETVRSSRIACLKKRKNYTRSWDNQITLRVCIPSIFICIVIDNRVHIKFRKFNTNSYLPHLSIVVDSLEWLPKSLHHCHFRQFSSISFCQSSYTHFWMFVVIVNHHESPFWWRALPLHEEDMDLTQCHSLFSSRYYQLRVEKLCLKACPSFLILLGFFFPRLTYRQVIWRKLFPSPMILRWGDVVGRRIVVSLEKGRRRRQNL
jgi:hypothetical protein